MNTLVLELTAAMLAQLYPEQRDGRGLTIDEAEEHLEAARSAATEDVPAELLLAIAREETHFRPEVVSRVRNRKGQVRLFCGPAQTIAEGSWRMCEEQQHIWYGYAVAVDEMEFWLGKSRGRLGRALGGHGCGNKMSLRCGSHGGKKVPYPLRVLRQLERIRKAGQDEREKAPTPPRRRPSREAVS